MLLPSFIVGLVAFSQSRQRADPESPEDGLKSPTTTTTAGAAPRLDADEVNAAHLEDIDEEDEEEEQINTPNDFARRHVLNPRSIVTAPTTWFGKLKSLLNPSSSSPTDPLSNPDDEYIPNYRYTPILSGVIIPLSILLEIPGLTELWYIRTLGNDIVEKQKNPVILNVGLGFSMACAVVANVALVMRFLEKRVMVMTIVCIVFLTIHDIINILAITIFGIQHRFDDGFTYGQSFWVTLCSTATSSITNITLLTDLLTTPSFSTSGSGLTRKQRSLVIIVIILLIYLAGGALIHSILEQLPFIDALYFTVCSVETIGFGDIVTTSTGGRVFLCVYAVLGIVILALAVGLTRDTVLEALEVSYRKRMHQFREKRRNASWRRRVSRRWKVAVEWRLREEVGKPVWVKDDPLEKENGNENWVKGVWMRFVDWLPLPQFFVSALDHSQSQKQNRKGYLGAVRHPHGMHLNLEALTDEQLEASAMEAGVPLDTLLPPWFWRRRRQQSQSHQAGEKDSRRSQSSSPPPLHPDETPLTQTRIGKMAAMLTSFALAFDRSEWDARGGGISSAGTGVSEASAGGGGAGGAGGGEAHREGEGGERACEGKPRRKSLTQQYDAFRTSMHNEERKAFVARVVVAWTLFFVFWFTGSLIFSKTESWSFGTSIYFCFIAFSTIGFGDYSPKSPAGRSVFVVWALLGVATMTILVSVISEAYSSQYKSAIHSGLLDRAVKRYGMKAREDSSALQKGRKVRAHPHRLSFPASSTPAAVAENPRSPTTSTTQNNEQPPPHEAITQSTTRLQKHLESLPHQILSQAKFFHEHIRYFVGSAPGGLTSANDIDGMPSGLRVLLDDIAGAENLGERVRRELLEDPEARQTLFTISIERGLRAMIHSAEEALDAMEERDYLLALQEHSRSHSQSQSLSPATAGSLGDAPRSPLSPLTSRSVHPPSVVPPIAPELAHHVSSSHSASNSVHFVD